MGKSKKFKFVRAKRAQLIARLASDKPQQNPPAGGATLAPASLVSGPAVVSNSSLGQTLPRVGTENKELGKVLVLMAALLMLLFALTAWDHRTNLLTRSAQTLFSFLSRL